MFQKLLHLLYCVHPRTKYYSYDVQLYEYWRNISLKRRWMKVRVCNHTFGESKVNGTSCSLIWPPSVSRIFYNVSSLIFTISAFVKKKKSLQLMEVKLRSKMSHWPEIPRRCVPSVSYKTVCLKSILSVSKRILY